MFICCFKKPCVGCVLPSEMSGGQQIYHEKQSKQLCALHTLNNLFQNSKAFTKEELDNLCYQLTPNSWINPHRSVLGLGNYDVNVIMAALQARSYDLTWWDKRKTLSPSDIDSSFGLILNLSSPSKVTNLFYPFKSKHWLAIKRFGNKYFNLDSKLQSPEEIGGTAEVKQYLQKHLQDKECELFLVTTSKQCTLATAEHL